MNDEQSVKSPDSETGRGYRFCLTEGHENETVEAKGLCKGCLTEARRMIEAGEVTEQQLIRAGLMLASKRGRPRKYRDFAAAVKEKLRAAS